MNWREALWGYEPEEAGREESHSAVEVERGNSLDAGLCATLAGYMADAWYGDLPCAKLALNRTERSPLLVKRLLQIDP